MSKPLKQVVIYSENYGDEDIQAKVNAWLSNRANDVYEHKITLFGVGDYLTAVIEYWEDK